MISSSNLVIRWETQGSPVRPKDIANWARWGACRLSRKQGSRERVMTPSWVYPRAFGDTDYYAGRMRLEKSQRNKIFEAITVAGLDPQDFDLDNDLDSDAEGRLIHRGCE